MLYECLVYTKNMNWTGKKLKLIFLFSLVFNGCREEIESKIRKKLKFRWNWKKKPVYCYFVWISSSSSLLCKSVFSFGMKAKEKLAKICRNKAGITYTFKFLLQWWSKVSVFVVEFYSIESIHFIHRWNIKKIENKHLFYVELREKVIIFNHLSE